MNTATTSTTNEFDRVTKSLRIVSKGFHGAVKEIIGDHLKTLRQDDGAGQFEIVVLNDGFLSTRTFAFMVGDPEDPDGETIEYHTAKFDLELGMRATNGQWTDIPGLFEAFGRWLRDEVQGS